MTIETRPQPVTSRYITYEEYLADEGENHSTEWLNGKVLDISLVSDEHNKVSGFLLLRSGGERRVSGDRCQRRFPFPQPRPAGVVAGHALALAAPSSNHPRPAARLGFINKSRHATRRWRVTRPSVTWQFLKLCTVCVFIQSATNSLNAYTTQFTVGHISVTLLN